MSTIKVNKIENTSTTDGGISIDNAGHVQIDGQQLPTAGALSHRNLVMNGAMQVAQRTTSATGVTTTGYKSVDRFKANISAMGTYTISQSTDAPDGFSNSLKYEVTTADASPAASDQVAAEYRVEAQDLQHLNYGSSSAKSLTLSFWVKSDVTGTYSNEFMQADNSSKHYSFSYTINTADTWEHKTVTVEGDTSGVINNDFGEGLLIKWWLGAGSNFTSGTYSTGSWAARTAANAVSSSSPNFASTVGNEWYITGVQLEVCSVATPFEHRSFGEELARCYRYFQKSYSYGTAVGANTTDGRYYFLIGTTSDAANKGGSVYLGTNMRVAPTTNFYNDAGTQGVIQIPASTVTPLLLKTGVIAIYVGNTTSREVAGAWTADAEF